MTREVRREGGRGSCRLCRRGRVEDEVIQGEVPHDLFLVFITIIIIIKCNN